MARHLAREFAVVGLGRMGANLARQAIGKGWRVIGQSRGGTPRELVELGLRPAERLQQFGSMLAPPRRVLLYIPAGRNVDHVLRELAKVLEPGDVIVDGGNSYWGDSIRRHRRLARHGIALVDAGTSGGVAGARHGACFMVGGDAAAVACVEPLLRALAVEGGFVHVGPAGSGHFVKLVHNGIEFGMLEAIGEGLDLLSHYRAPLPIADILHNWRHGSVIRGWLMDLMERAYREQGGLTVDPHVEDTGEVDWLVDDAMSMEVAVPVIALSVMQLVASRDDDRNWARAVAMLRHGFGGHPFGRDAVVARERRDSRVGGFPPVGDEDGRGRRPPGDS
jgi:6-phosphogluconate dehydrogenase